MVLKYIMTMMTPTTIAMMIEDPSSSLTIVIITKGDPYRGFSGCCIDSSTDNAPNEIHLILIIISVMMILMMIPMMIFVTDGARVKKR